MERLLLVETVSEEQSIRAVSFPYLLGHARTRGVTARWLRFGVPADQQVRLAEHGLGLGEGDRETLRDELASFQPTRIAFSRRPSRSLAALAREAVPHATLTFTGEGVDAPVALGDGLRALEPSLAAWSAFLSLPSLPAGAPFLDVLPDFGFVPANVAARRTQPLPCVVLGTFCTYRRSLEKNDVFRGVDLTPAAAHDGCTFCVIPGPLMDPRMRFSVENARAQLAALARTLPALPESGDRLEVRLVGDAALLHAEELAGIVGELELRPSDLLFDSRAEVLVRCREVLARAASRLAGSGHRLRLTLIGLESFARSELARMNKGATPQDNLDCIRVLLELERAFPAVFDFRSRPALSTISYTPWTTLEELRLNLRIVAETGIAPLVGAKVFSSRVRLMPGLPLTELARRDGLLAREHEDPAFDTAAFDLYGEELPWRFADPRVSAPAQLLVRLGHRQSRADDELTGAVGEVARRAQSAGLAREDFALAIVDEAEHAGDTRLSAAELLARVSARRPAQPRAWDEDPASGHQRLAALLVTLARERVKPVGRMERVPLAALPRFLETHRPPNAQVRNRAEGCADVFFGARAEDVARAAALTAEEARRPDVTAELGALLGYPSCCTRAFAALRRRAQRRSIALHYARRLSAPGGVDPLLNPFAFATQHVPCAAECADTLALARTAGELSAAAWGREPAERIRLASTRPWLALLDQDGSSLELIPEGEPGDRFRFSPGLRWFESPDLLRAAGADEVVLEPERLFFLRAGAAVADFSAAAVVWWHVRPLQRRFWDALFALGDLMDSARVSVDARGEPPETAALRLEVERLLTTGLARAGLAATLAFHRDGREGRVRLTLSRESEEVELLAAPVSTGQRWLFEAGGVAFSHPSDRPLDTPGKRALVEGLRRALSADR